MFNIKYLVTRFKLYATKPLEIQNSLNELCSEDATVECPVELLDLLSRRIIIDPLPGRSKKLSNCLEEDCPVTCEEIPEATEVFNEQIDEKSFFFSHSSTLWLTS